MRGVPDPARQITRLNESLAELRRDSGLPPFAETNPVWTSLWYDDAHHTTSGHGNPLRAGEVRALLQQGKAIGGRLFVDYSQVRDYAEKAKWVYSQAHRANPITISSAEIQRLTNIAPHTIDSSLLPWVEHTCARLGDQRPGAPVGMIRMISTVYNEFLRILIDSVDSRPGPRVRLLLNLLLVRLGFPPIVIDRRVAGQPRENRYPRVTDDLLVRGVVTSLGRFLSSEPPGPETMLPLAHFADDTFSLAALRQAAKRGRLRTETGPEGKRLTCRVYVDSYRATRHRRSA